MRTVKNIYIFFFLYILYNRSEFLVLKKFIIKRTKQESGFGGVINDAYNNKLCAKSFECKNDRLSFNGERLRLRTARR